MKHKVIFIGIIFLFCHIEICLTQSAPPMIEIKEDAPDWMKMLNSDRPNVIEITKKHKAYYASHTFEKNSYTQYFKRFMRWARPYVDHQGFIQLPDNQTLIAKERKAKELRTSTQRMSNWTFIGPNETWDTDGSPKVTWQTNIYQMDVAPSNASVLYAGGESGGLWKTTDKGLTWALTTKDILHGAFGAVKIHPTNSDIVYAGTGGKIIKTINGGTTWTTVYTESNLWTNEIAISHSDPNVVLAATDSGLLRSINGGTSWTKLMTNMTWTVKKKEGNTNVFYAIRDQGSSSEFIRSMDQGASWTVISNGWYAPTAGESVTGAIVATCPTNSNKLYSYLCGNGGTLNGYVGVFVSNDNGSTWSNTNPSNLVGGVYSIPTHTNLMANNGTTGFNQGFYDMAIVVNPNNENELIAGGTSWFKSTDGGATWNSLGGYVGTLPWSHPDIQWCVASGNDLWIASDGGINYSNNFGQTIEARMNGVSGSDMWGFGSGWNTDILVGGRYHNGNMAYHESFPAGKFYRMGGAEAPTGYVNPGPGNKVYHSDIGGHKLKPGFGNNVDYFSVGAWPNESYAYYANSEMVFHPNYYNTIFLGKDNTILKSIDGGISFTNLYTFPGTIDNEVFEIQIARSNPDIMYCSQWDGTDDKLWKSINGGVTWSAMTPLPLPNNNDRVKMAVSSADANILWVAVTYGSNGKKIYKSTNGGSTWTNLTTNILNNVTIQGIMAQYGTNGGIYLGTNVGVYYRNNTHSDWQPFSTGLPLSVETNRLKPFYRDQKIRNGCWGFGVWESPLFEPSSPEAMPTVNAKNIGCSRDTVYFDDYSVLNHQGATWQWSFPGASYVSSTTARNPKVIYANPGSFDVSLTISNAQNQTSTKSIPSMVNVSNACVVDTIPGKALRASGSDKHAYIPDLNLTNVNNFTVTAWVKPNGIQADYSAIFMGDGPDAAGFNFKDGSNKLAYHWPGGQWWWNSNINVPANQWSFVVMVVKPTGITLYCNEQSSTHNFTLTPTSIPSARIGSYRNWGDRNVNGWIDEVALYNRALTTGEIRDLRHLTKKPTHDNSLIAYYQFNSNETHDYDKVGIRHILLTGGATKETSTAPIGGGVSTRMIINSGGLKDFGVADVKAYFPTSGTYPNGEVVVSKINQLPDFLPNTGTAPNCYYIVNNYGSNTNFSTLDSIKFYNSGNVANGCQPLHYQLYKRNANQEGDTWGEILDVAENYKAIPPPPFVSFRAGNNVNSFGQFYVNLQGRPNLTATEVCNGIDDDCDGLVDENYSLVVTNNADSGENSLRAIIQCAQNGEVITFNAAVDTITLLSPIVIGKNITLQDLTGNAVVIKANLSQAGFTSATSTLAISANANVQFHTVHFYQLNNNVSKPLMQNNGNLTMTNCKLSGLPPAILKHSQGATYIVNGIVEIE